VSDWEGKYNTERRRKPNAETLRRGRFAEKSERFYHREHGEHRGGGGKERLGNTVGILCTLQNPYTQRRRVGHPREEKEEPKSTG
jgi:hypothetical protein